MHLDANAASGEPDRVRMARSMGSVANLCDPLHAGDMAPDAFDRRGLQRAASHRAQAALRRWFPFLLPSALATITGA